MGLNNVANNRWCGVNYLTFESTAAQDVHVLGDSIQIAPSMPKSGHMAHNQGKVAAAAILAQLSGWELNSAPMLTNTCYSFVDDRKGSTYTNGESNFIFLPSDNHSTCTLPMNCPLLSAKASARAPAWPQTALLSSLPSH